MNEKLIKPIVGTWFMIYWFFNPTHKRLDLRYYYWDTATHDYTAEQWDALLKDLSSIGQKYLVLINTFGGYDGKECVYDSKVARTVVKLGTPDPLEAVFTAADKYGMKIFATSEYYNSYDFEDVFDEKCIADRKIIMTELVEKYGHHESFFGWYLAREAHIGPYFDENFIRYVNETAAFMREITPHAKILTAPYGTKNARADETYIDQLRRLDVDIIAYQDCVGCKDATIEQSRQAFETLRKAHDAAGRSALWADVETFEWDNGENRLDSRLIPTSWARLKDQLAVCSPYVDEVLTFSFQGLMTNPDSIAYCDYPEAARLYGEYVGWLKETHPDVMAEDRR